MSAKSTTRVVTRESLIQQLLPLIQDALGSYTGNGANAKQGITFATVVLIAMQVVERYSETIGKLAGPDKLEAAKQLVPEILAIAVQNGAIEQIKADELLAQFNTGAVVVEQLVDAYVLLSKNPQVIQAVEAAQAAVSGCILRCKTKRAERIAAGGSC